MRLITSPMTALAVILASVIMLAACGGGEDSDVAAATSTPTAEPTSSSGELIATATPFASRPTPTIVSDNGNDGGGNSGGSESSDATPTPTATATPAAVDRTHVVVVGDTLSGIAEQYGSSVEAIMEANGITDPSVIFVGQELTIAGATADPGTAATPEAGSLIHVVVEGDTLSGIAEHYGTTVEAITEANGLTDSVIWIGQELTIPEAAPAPEPTAAPAATPTATPTATPEGGGDGGESTTYIVQDGDTATDIAAAFEVTLQALADANDLTIAELNNLLVGQELTIPVSGE